MKLYFDSINDFLEKSGKIFLLHETNQKNPNEECYFYIVEKNNFAPHIQAHISMLSKKSLDSIYNLSEITQFYISKKHDNFFYIALVNLNKDSIQKDKLEIKENSSKVLQFVYPELTTLAELEKKSNKKLHKTNTTESNSEVTEEADPDFFEFIQKNSDKIVTDITLDIKDKINATSKYFMEQKDELLPELQKTAQTLKNKLPSLENLTKKSKLFESISKQVDIIKKMKPK
jgi:hypothetical protein